MKTLVFSVTIKGHLKAVKWLLIVQNSRKFPVHRATKECDMRKNVTIQLGRETPMISIFHSRSTDLDHHNK